MGPEIDRTAETPPNGYGRRTFVQWLTYGLGGLAAVISGVPIIGFFLGTPKGPREWVTLGRVDAFPVDETRMVTFDNPIREPWDGITAHTGVYVRYEGKDQKQEHQFLVLAVNCALGLPGLVVPAIRSLHVPLPWGRLLRQRRTRIRTTAARALPLPVASSQRDA